MKRIDVVVADVGGTNCRFALASIGAAGIELRAAETYSSRSATGLEPLLTEYLDTLVQGGLGRPTSASLAIAGPVEAGRCRATNLPWDLDAARIAERCRLDACWLLNDFEAVAWGVPCIPRELLRTLQAGTPDPAGPVAVLGPGTGLGEALAVPTEAGWRVLPTEGGHTDFGPRDDEDDALLAMLRARYGRVSSERVLSGPGLAAIFESLVRGATGRTPETVALHDGILASDDPARDVIALRASDRLAGRAVERFVDLLGAEAGNLALKSIPTGGLFVAGGLPPRFLDVVEDRFLAAFLDKGRMKDVLRRIPVHVVLDGQIGLRGAAARAANAAGSERIL